MSFFKNIIRIGTGGVSDKTIVNRIILSNKIAVYPIFFYISISIYCILSNYPRIVFTNLIGLVGVGVTLYLNYCRKYSTAKIIIIGTSSVVVLLYYKLMMDAAGPFLFFFPIITMFVLFTDVAKERNYIITAAIIIALCYFGAIFIPNAVFKPVPLGETLHKFIFLFCTIACALLSVLYIYFNFKVNIENERILKLANKKAEEVSEMKERFLNNMSHELRTPLNGIIGTIHLLKAEGQTATTNKHFPVLENLAEHMLGLVNNILDHSKISSGKLELNYHWFSFAKWINSIESLFQISFQEKGITFGVHIDHDLKDVQIFSDALRLQQVIYNLLSNALKFTHTGEVRIEVTRLKGKGDKSNLYFSVKDTGIGIPLHKQEKIFESFSQADSATTRKYGGTGLGLSISNDLVDLFGGKLKLKSEEGIGSNFYFTIEVLCKDELEMEDSNLYTANQKDIAGMAVLLAEDNPINMMVAKKMLEKWDVKVTVAVDGKMALEYFQNKSFDLLLIDLEMPEMDGKSTVAAIRNLDKEIPCLAFTAGVYNNMKDDLNRAGFNDYILKPFNPDDLKLKIHKYIAK